MTQDSELIEKALEPVRQLLLQKSQASTQEQGEEYQYKIDEDIINEIQKNIVDKVDRFNTWEDFVKEAITNTMDFWTKPKRMMTMGLELWPDFTPEMKGEIKKNAPEFYYQMEQATKNSNEIPEMIQHISDAKAKLSKEEFSDARDFLGIDVIYFSDSIPCARGEKAIHPMANFFKVLRRSFSIQRLIIEYEG